MSVVETILVLDFGSQYTQLIARRIREAQVYSEVVPFNTPLEEIRRQQPRGIILSGGPDSVALVTLETLTMTVSSNSSIESWTDSRVMEPVVEPGGMTIESPERV